jgi:hypothetical protein
MAGITGPNWSDRIALTGDFDYKLLTQIKIQTLMVLQHVLQEVSKGFFSNGTVGAVYLGKMLSMLTGLL